ncbi:hypothetical protein Aperf_G00000126610 [Anoplocephala perfoliata]
MEHPESEYIKRVLGEPLRGALAAVVLYQPLDPIHFLATYLKRWAVKVRDNRIRRVVNNELNKLLMEQIPFNIQLQAERAIRYEQNFLKVERTRVEEGESRRQAEMKIRRELMEANATEAANQLRTKVWPHVLEEVAEMATDVAFTAWKRAKRARKKVEAARVTEEMVEEAEDES